ncbi:hypothetical protein LEMA_P101030.1 [Plenodomus lingam JN3]|uniref:Peroxidase n=1 Tax=Leptosphaeria maculans (strain JN3 / isolate v23.1.3 / race Av1-4-5-6-7-8) TaxID=985895 RepID=E5A0B2_LEPMJ|nr:hypothetical protein LEMA_P101030.1 [Plenodomus lingam JN3]CBX96972.1 hypothetical protein LEMA_P101030.1 [Plenodomus lingam JN3]
MYINTLVLAVLVPLNTVQAFNLTSTTPPPQHTPNSSHQTATTLLTWARSKLPSTTKRTSCPPVWSTISTALTAQFLADGQCTDAARAAIRAAFHDCFNGACDGSLILADECANAENSGLQQLCSALLNISIENQVGVADLIQFAAAHAIKTCPGGPTVPVVVGRRDASEANSQGVLPHGDALGGDLVTLFASKGLTPTDLTALIVRAVRRLPLPRMEILRGSHRRRGRGQLLQRARRRGTRRL